MLSGSTVLSLLLGTFVLVLPQSQGYQLVSSYPLSSSNFGHREQPSKGTEDGSVFPKLASEIFGSSSQENSDRSRYHEDNDSSLSSDETSLLDLPRQASYTKRRNGPTLSVVNPLEILRQRLMLDNAQRRIHENQQRIVANARLLENIGKRSFRQSDQDSSNLLGEGVYRA